MVKLYAPNPYPHGSSIAHVDQDTDADFKTGRRDGTRPPPV